jgi:hypothetical protein
MRIVLPAVLLILVALAVFIQTRPDRFHIERSATINAPSATILPHINDFHRWAAWSPFEKMDPQLRRSYAGPAAGIGAAYSWVGNNKVGEGSMKITEMAVQVAEAGATITLGPQDMSWGDRFAEVTDPFGHQWILRAPKA